LGVLSQFLELATNKKSRFFLQKTHSFVTSIEKERANAETIVTARALAILVPDADPFLLTR